MGHSKFLHISSVCYKASKTEKELGGINPQPLAYRVQLCACQRHQHNVERFLFQRQGSGVNISFCSTETLETDPFERANSL